VKFSEDETSLDNTADMFALVSQVNDYYSRMMNCMMQHVQHQMTVGYMVISASVSSSADGRLIVIRGMPVRIYSEGGDSNSQGIHHSNNYT